LADLKGIPLIRQLCLLQDAMHSMNGVLDAEPDPKAAFNLVLCTFALGDKEMMKQAFSKLVEVVHKFFLHAKQAIHNLPAMHCLKLLCQCWRCHSHQVLRFDFPCLLFQ